MINLTKDQLFEKSIEIFRNLHNNSVKVSIIDITNPLLDKGTYVVLTINPISLIQCYCVVAGDSIITTGSIYYKDIGYISISSIGKSISLTGFSIKDFRKFISKYSIPFGVFDFKLINLEINKKQNEVDSLNKNLNEAKVALKQLEDNAKLIFDICKIPIEFE